MKDTILEKDPLLLFKLDGLRACAAAQAPLRMSGCVRFAQVLHQKRKTYKNSIKRRLRYLFSSSKKPSRLSVLVHIKGGIGDVAMTRVFIQKLRETVPQAHISFAYDSKEVVDMIFSDGLIDAFQPTVYLPSAYDLVISGCHLLTYDYVDKTRIKQFAPHLLPLVEKGLSVQRCFKEFAVCSPHLDGMLAEIAIAHGGSRITNLGWFSGLDVHQNDLAPLRLSADKSTSVLQTHSLSAKNYITIHDGINVNTDTSSGYPTRCWPEDYWKDLCCQIKQHFPQISIVQLGGAKSHPFAFADISLVGKTPLAQLPYILDNALLHIDGESGMVHLAHLTSVRSVVLFGPSKAAYLGYARNINISAPDCGGCMNIYPDWMTRCLFDKPHNAQCLSKITPQQVFQEVAKVLNAYKK